MAFNKQPSLGAMLLHHLRSTTAKHHWDRDALDQIKSTLRNLNGCGQVDTMDDLACTLREWLDTIPEEDANRIEALLPRDNRHFLACLLPSLCLWARQQAWGAHVSIADSTETMLVLLYERRDTDMENIRTVQVATRVVRDVVSLGRSDDNIWALVGPWLLSNHMLWPITMGLWEKERHLFPVYLDAWMNLGEAAIQADARDTNTKSTPLIERWEAKIRHSMRVLNAQDEAALLTRLMRASLIPEKLRVCYSARASSWLNPVVQQTLDSLLPTNDTDRLAKLPWFTNNAEANRSVALAYAPTLAKLLDGLDPTSWSDASRHGALLKALENAQGMDLTAMPSLDERVLIHPNI